MKAVMGIDPGVRGGVAILDQLGFVIFTCSFRPDMTEWSAELLLRAAVAVLKAYGPLDCYIEKVGYIRGDGGKGAFTFGRIYGFLRGYLIAHNVTLFDVPPVLWQSRLDCLTGGDKNVSKRKAMELFPQVKMTHAIADALLIAEYGRRQIIG